MLDAAGDVLRPAKLWNDTESAADAAALVEEMGAAAWAEACGSVPVASFTITKLRWLRRCEPDVFARIAGVRLPHDWLTSPTDAGRPWGDRPRRGVRDRLVVARARRPTAPISSPSSTTAVAWDDVLPPVLGPAAMAGEWEGMAVAPGTGDNMAAALGLGLRPGDLVLSLGTSGTAFCVSDRPSADDSGAVAGFADATGRFLPLVCTLNATKVTDAVARLLGVDAAGFDALASSAPAGGSGGVVVVPHFDGERTPNRPDATGSIVGLRSDVSREQLARATVEGVVCNLLAGVDELARWEPGVTSGRIVLIGGGARSAAYRSSVADLTGRTVLVPEAGEPVARGAAVQAAAVLTGRPFDEITAAWGLGRAAVVEPTAGVDGAAVRAAYAEAARDVPS